MSEEAYLVISQSPSLSGVMPYTDGRPSESADAQPSSSSSFQTSRFENGPILDDDETILDQFNSDAIKHAGFGPFQIIAALIAGLGLSTITIQVYAVYYILPSAELEFCIEENEKSWMQFITLIGLSIGAFFTGYFATMLGRKRAMLRFLLVSLVFSVVAAFMPKYWPFMMARFCAALGIGGVLPAAFIYLTEFTPESYRSRILNLFGSVAMIITGLILMVAVYTIPTTIEGVIQENKQHFSAWHEYLLISILPTVFAIICTVWLPESPKYLLKHGREVEALEIYQKIYRTNKARGGRYSLTELELPGMQIERNFTPTASVLKRNINLFQLLTWFVSLLLFQGLTLFMTEFTRAYEGKAYNNKTIYKTNLTFEHMNFVESIDNVVFRHCLFVNCTFRRIFISHSTFDQCKINQTEFGNVKTSHTLFFNTRLQDIKFIDTDLGESNFLDCEKINVNFLGLPQTCKLDFESNLYVDELWKCHLCSFVCVILMLAVVAEIKHIVGRFKSAGIYYLLALCLSILLMCVRDKNPIIIISGIIQALIIGGLASLTFIDNYSPTLGCIAIGLWVATAELGAIIGNTLYLATPSDSPTAASILTTLFVLSLLVTSQQFKDTPSRVSV